MPRTSRFVFVLVLTAALAGSCRAPHLSPPAGSIEAEADRRVTASELLLQKLTDGNTDERERAARAMGRIQSPGYLDALAGALNDSDAGVRHAALFAIGQLGLVPHQAVDPGAVEAVEPMLQADDPATVAAALHAVGKIAGTSAAKRIHPFLSHEDPGVRSEAAFALFRLRFAPVWRGDVDNPPALPDAAVDALKVATKDPDPAVRFAATYGFSRYAEPRARDALVDALSDGDALVRLFAARGLGHVAGERNRPHLIALLQDDDPGVRIEAVGALRRAGFVDVVERQIDDPSFHVRAAVARSLADAVSSSSLQALKALAKDPSISVRVAAIGALTTRLDPPTVLRHAVDWAGSFDWRIRAAAARSAGQIAEHGISMARHLFKDLDTRVQAGVLDGLAGSAAGDAIVTAALERDDLALRGTAVGLVAEREHLARVELLTAAYNDSPGEEWIEVRESIADALSGIDGAEQHLRRIATKDEAPSVRAKASAALDDPPPSEAAEPYAVSPRLDHPPPPGVRVDLVTKHGTMRIELLSEEAPVHVAAFLERVEAGFYDGLIWHRVVPNFVIQGGDPRGDGWGGDGETLRDEINTARYHRGAVGMPKTGKDTGGCQLFVTHVPTPHLDGNYTIFGRVVSGLEVIDAVEVGDEIVSIRRVS